MFVLCGNSGLRTHIPSIAAFAHQDPRMELVSGKHLDETIDTRRLESMMSFLQIRTSMSLQEKIRQSGMRYAKAGGREHSSSWRPSPEEKTLTAS